MSLPRPSGLKAPSKISKPSGLPYPKSGTGIPTPGSVHKAQSAIAKSARAAGISAVQAEKYAADVVQSFKGPELPNPPPPADDFIIGDRVWVSGTKPGFIAYLGETQFAGGEWAGVVLDKPEGKNDGSVQNIRYFQCEPKRGVFARISKLSRTPGLMPSTTPKPEDSVSETGANSVKGAPNGSGLRPTTQKFSLTGSKGPTGSSSSLNKSPPTSMLNIAPRTSSTPLKKSGLNIGDRVLVSGTKTGTLRFIGATDFAKGDWAGVELDEKQGKNDGAVAGKRYFECRPMFGLFAPVHKVAKLMSAPTGVGTGSTTPSPQARSLMNTSLRLTRERSGSQESISSISSSASSVSRSRVRLGVTSLSNQLPQRRLIKPSPSSSAKTSQRPSTLNLSATTTALQKALKEKEEHIEQLLRERDLERSEVARAAAQMDEAEGQMTSMRTEHEKFKEDADGAVIKLKLTIESLEKEKSELNCKLEDERRKVEDLQFQIEEEAITKDDLESRTEEEEAKLKELERNYKKEKERADKHEQDLFGLKALMKDQTTRLSNLEETNTNYLDQIEELTHKLSQSENKVKVFESTRLEEGAKTSQVSIELEEKTSRVSELEEVLSTRNREVKDLHIKLMEINDEMKNHELRKQKMQDTIDNLTEQLNSSGDASNHLTTEIQNLKSQISDLQRRLDSSQDKEKETTIEKNKLEEQMSEMMRNSGDSSKRLSLLNDQITERNRKIQDLQEDLSNSTQKWGKISDEMTQLRAETLREKEALLSQHEKTAEALRSQVEDLQQALEKSNKKMKDISEDLTKDKEDAINRKLSELNQLKKQLEQNKEELEKQEVKTQAHKQVLDTITMEKEAMAFEKEKAEKQVKRLESEKDTINTDLIHVRVEVTKVQSQCEKAMSERDSLAEQIQELKTETEETTKSKTELQKQKDLAIAEKEKMTGDLESLQRDVMENKAMLQQKDMSIEELQKEVEKLRTETQQQQETLSSISEQASSTGELQDQLNESRKKIKELEKTLEQSEVETDAMKVQLQFSALVVEERKRLEEQNQKLTKDVDSLQSQFTRELEKQESAQKSLRTEMDNTSQLLQQRMEEIEQQNQEIANLKNENASLEVYRSSASSLEAEQQELRSTVKRLELLLEESRKKAETPDVDVSGDAVATKLRDEKRAAEQQVEFLNSVIVDLQGRNQELKVRLEAMESGVLTNGASDNSMETETPSKRAPPRLFCDICDVFDQHDTDDCPLQAMDYEDDAPSPSQHHGDRKHMRPYCDICEEFHEQCIPPDEAGVERPMQVNTVPEADVNFTPYEDGLSKREGGGPLDFKFGSEKDTSSKSLQSQSVVYHSSSDSVEIKSVSDKHGTMATESTFMEQHQEDKNDTSGEATGLLDFEPITQKSEIEQVFSELRNEKSEEETGDRFGKELEESDEDACNTGGYTSGEIDKYGQTGNDEVPLSLENTGLHSGNGAVIQSSYDNSFGNDGKNVSEIVDCVSGNSCSKPSTVVDVDNECKRSDREEYLEAIKELSGQKVPVDCCIQNDPLGVLYPDPPIEDSEDIKSEGATAAHDDLDEVGEGEGKVDTISSDTGAEISAQDRTSTSEDFLSGKESLGGSTEDVSDIDEDITDAYLGTGPFDETKGADAPILPDAVGDTKQASLSHNDDPDMGKKDENCEVS